MMNALVGVLNGLAVWLLGMPDPLLFGTLAFLLNYVPILGPITGVVIFFFVASSAFRQSGKPSYPPRYTLGYTFWKAKPSRPCCSRAASP
jgi:hypothetical protein